MLGCVFCDVVVDTCDELCKVRRAVGFCWICMFTISSGIRWMVARML